MAAVVANDGVSRPDRRISICTKLAIIVLTMLCKEDTESTKIKSDYQVDGDPESSDEARDGENRAIGKDCKAVGHVTPSSKPN